MDNKIYAGNLTSTVTERDIVVYFSPHGDVLKVDIAIDETTLLPRGFAFVTYCSLGSAKSALSENGNEFMGRDLIVKLIIDDNERDDSICH